MACARNHHSKRCQVCGEEDESVRRRKVPGTYFGGKRVRICDMCIGSYEDFRTALDGIRDGVIVDDYVELDEEDME